MSKVKDRPSRSERFIRDMPAFVFKNEHGEQFNVYCNGTFVFLGGDAVRDLLGADKFGDEIIPLFNNIFSIWTREELYKLGEGLMALNKPEGKDETHK